MRWLKHMTNSRNDESILRLMDEYGVEGYGAYWLVIEVLAQHMDESKRTELTLSIKNWRKCVPFAAQKLTKWFALAAQMNLFSVSFDGDFVTVDCPKLLKFRDEWSRKRERNSGATPVQRIDIDIEEDKDLNTGAKRTPQVPSGFVIFHQDGEMRISQRDFEAWQKAYPLLDLTAELQALSDWTRSTREWTKKNAFHACSAALKVKNEKARTYAVEKKRQEDSPPPPQRFN